MLKTTFKKDKKTKGAYRSLGFDKISAPNKPKGEPRGAKIENGGDLRAKKAR